VYNGRRSADRIVANLYCITKSVGYRRHVSERIQAKGRSMSERVGVASQLLIGAVIGKGIGYSIWGTGKPRDSGYIAEAASRKVRCPSKRVGDGQHLIVRIPLNRERLLLGTAHRSNLLGEIPVGVEGILMRNSARIGYRRLSDVACLIEQISELPYRAISKGLLRDSPISVILICDHDVSALVRDARHAIGIIVSIALRVTRRVLDAGQPAAGIIRVVHGAADIVRSLTYPACGIVEKLNVSAARRGHSRYRASGRRTGHGERNCIPVSVRNAQDAVRRMGGKGQHGLIAQGYGEPLTA